MANKHELCSVVAIDTNGQPIIKALDNWVVEYHERRQVIEISCGTYRRIYDLRTDVLAIAQGEVKKKIALGKTLGRLALTGLLNGKHAAYADLRWGGMDRDVTVELEVVMKDTTTVMLLVSGQVSNELSEYVSESVRSEVGQSLADKLIEKIKAMVDDGRRVIDELVQAREQLTTESEQAKSLIESGQTFQERSNAKERHKELLTKLAEHDLIHNAVIYSFALKDSVDRQHAAKTQAPALPTAQAAIADQAAPAVTSIGSNVVDKPHQVVEPPVAIAKPLIAIPQPPSPPPLVKQKPQTSLKMKLVKLCAWLVGGFIGLVLALITGPGFFILGIPFLFLGGWLSLKMLDALMSR